ncbi:Efflux pump radE [Fusarium oxysporum f. sp. rapae]|uniref:Efflux pump radE n=1 Tax=Fusarium oxysporum f. sp. rapae TaxID=485398 RepID=A0A8J5PDB3_FUSOX|nr:Efflux pump radE [Fusarium oxysporum f. sp. rapae]
MFESSSKATEPSQDWEERIPDNGNVIEALSDASEALSREHAEYLMKRHGTLDLDPLPGPDDADPYNWPNWKKIINLMLVVVHACMATFIAAAIIPAFPELAEDLGVSLQQVSYLTTLQIAFLAVAPAIHRPFANIFGRRPMFLVSLLASMLGNIGCAKSSSYTAMAACRAIVAFFISPAAALGSGVVTETFLRKHRARCLGIWTLMSILGVPLAPLTMGFIAAAGGYQWIYWTLSIINGVQLVAYFFLGPETLYVRGTNEPKGSSFKRQYLNFKRIDPRPLSLNDFIHPFGLWHKISVVLPTVAHAMVFLFCNTLIAVEIPNLFGEKFGFDSQQLGLQFIGMIVGHALGIALAGAGNQIVTTVLISYAVDRHPQEAASIGVFVTFIRQVWAFIGPFWFPPMFTSVGLAASSGIAAGLIIAVSVIPTIFIHWNSRSHPAGEKGRSV